MDIDKKMKNNKKNTSYKATSKVFLILLMFSMAQIGLVSAFEFDNVGTYYEDTNTMKIINMFGLGSPIVNITLLSPLDVKVIAGEERLVAWYEIDNFGTYDGNEIFDIVDTYDLKRGNSEIQKNIKYKLQKIELVKVPDYIQVCVDGDLDGEKVEKCTNEESGTKEIEVIEWKAFNKNADLLEGKVVIGLFTEVEVGEKVEWIPNMYGVEIDEWASWTESLNSDLRHYYNFEVGSGTTLIDRKTPAGINVTMPSDNFNTDGIIGNAYTFATSRSAVMPWDMAWDEGTVSIWAKSSTATNVMMGSLDAGIDEGDFLFGHCGDFVSQICFLLEGGGQYFLHPQPMQNDNAYFNYVAVWNTTTMWLYHNGTQIGGYLTQPSIQPSGTSAGGWRLGASVIGSAEAFSFNGVMDEIGYWNRSLTASEISDLYNSGVGITYINVFETSPTINLNVPTNYYNSSVEMDDFEFNMTYGLTGTDWKNYTFIVWNGSVDQVVKRVVVNGTIDDDCFVSDGDGTYVEIECTGQDLLDGNYTWNVQGCNDQDLCAYGTSNYTFTVDTTSPVISSLNNLTNLTTFSLPVNSTWNFTTTDIHLQNCWYNSSDNTTITIITCNSTIYTQWETQGSKLINYYVNDSFGLETEGSKSIFINFVSSNNYHSPDATGETGTINFDLYVNSTSIPTTTAYLWINNTRYDPDSTNPFTNYVHFNYSLFIPDGWGNYSGNNFNYYWNYTIDTLVDNRSTTLDNFTIYSVDFDDCSSFPIVLINMSLFDEEDNDFVNATAGASVEIDLTLTSGSSSWDYHNSWINNQTASEDLDALVCVPEGVLNNTNFTIDYTIGFESTDHVWEFFFLDQGIVDNNKDTFNSLTNRTINLYDLLSVDSTSFLFNYFDEDGLSVSEVIVHTFRKYIGEGVFREIERSKQNDDGDTIVHLVEEDVIYYFIVSQNGTILYTSSTYTALCQTTPCEIQLEESGGFQEFTDDWDLVDNGGYTLNSYSSTRIVNLTYVLTSPSTFNLSVYKLTSDGSYEIIGSNTSTGVTDELYISVPTISGNTSFFATIDQDGTFLTSSWIDFDEQAGTYFGTTLSLFLGALIILALGLMAVSEGSPTILFLMLGMFLAMVLGLVDYRTTAGVSILIYFLIAGGIIIWKLTRRNR